MGWEGAAQGPPEAPAPSYNLPACPVSPVPHWCTQPEQEPSRRGPTSATCPSLGNCSSLSRSAGDVPQTGKLRHGRGVELRPGSPTLITIGCRGVDDIRNSRGIRRDAPLERGLCAELTRRSPRRWQPGAVFGRFGCAPGDRDLPHPPGNGPTAPGTAPQPRSQLPRPRHRRLPRPQPCAG